MREGLLPLLFESEERLPEALRVLLPSFRAMQRAQGARMATICRVFGNVVTLLEGDKDTKFGKTPKDRDDERSSRSSSE